MPAITFPALENGEWVTRTIDLHQLSARNPKTQVSTVNASDSLPSTPTLGLLSKTVIRSPVVNQILPACLRHKKSNDVVFVGEDFIHVRQILLKGGIEHIATKHDFGAKIWACRVLGRPSQPKDIRIKNWANRVISDEDLETAYGEPDDPMDVDHSEQDLPPQVLVLTLETQELLFVSLHLMPDRSYKFRQTGVPLPTSLDYLEALGRHLAVDPRSKAIAVGALEGSFAIYQTKEVSQLRGDISRGLQNRCLIKAQQTIKVNGVILQMDFLYPGPTDDEYVVLVLVVARNGRTQIHSYAWDFSNGLEERPEDTRIEKLDGAEYQSPLLLIPIQNRRDFLLICERGTFIYTNVLRKNSSIDSFELFQHAPNYPGSSSRPPLWTSWARPIRRYHDLLEGWHDYGSEHMDFIYLLREDGAVAYIVLSGADCQNITVGDAANYKGHFNAAFAVLPMGFKDPDILVAAGSASDGCLRKIGDFHHKDNRDILVHRTECFKGDLLGLLGNWAPITDITSFGVRGPWRAPPKSPSGFFVTSGKQPHGMVSELRSGIQASLIASHTLEPDTMGAQIPTDIWPLFDSTHRELRILFSYPTHSKLLYVNLETPETPATDIQSECVDPLGPTIWAWSPFDRYFIHVTLQGVQMFQFEARSSKLSEPGSTIARSGHSILAATSNRRLGTMLIISYDGHQYCLEVWMFTKSSDDKLEYEKVNGTAEIIAEPTCMATHAIDDGLLIAVGTTTGVLLLFTWDEHQELSPLSTFSLVQSKVTAFPEHDLEGFRGFSSSAIGSICENIVILSTERHTDAQPPKLHLLCGLRDGSLRSILILGLDARHNQVAGNDIKIGQVTAVSMGSTAVKLKAGNEDSSSTAIAYNDSDLCIVSIDSDDPNRLQVNKILLKDDVGLGLQAGPVAACTWILTNEYPPVPELAGSLVCTSGNTWQLLKLDSERTMIPRGLPLESTPERMIFCNWLRMFVVAGTKSSVSQVPPSNPRKLLPQTKRVTRGVLEFIRPRPSCYDPFAPPSIEKSLATNTESQKCGSFELLRGERIFTLTQWTHQRDQGSKYGHLLVGTGPSSPASLREGRLLFIEASVDQSGQVTCKIKKPLSHSKPVRSIAIYQGRYFICGVGKSLRVYGYEEQERKLRRVGEKELSSDVVHITTETHFVHVSTLEDSICVFHVVVENGTPHFTTVGLDHLARSGLTHLPLRTQLPKSDRLNALPNSHSDLGESASDTGGKASLLLVSDQENNLVGLQLRCAIQGSVDNSISGNEEELVRPLTNTAPLLFTASLPRSITRLHQAPNLRPPWMPQCTDLAGILEDSIIGSATDGTIFNFSLLSEAGLNLLRFLSDLYENYERDKKEAENGMRWDGTTLSEREQAARNHLRSGAEDGNLFVGTQRDKDRFKHKHHIDGDLLTRMIEGGSKMLRQMILGQTEETSANIKHEEESVSDLAEFKADVMDQTPPSFPDPVFDPSHERPKYSKRPDRLISELAELVKDLIKEDDTDTQRWDGDLITVTVRYLKDILEPIV